MLQSAIDSMLKKIIEERPNLTALETDESVLEYLRPAIDWQQNDNFPHVALLQNCITTRIEQLYGQETANEAVKQLKKSWVIETGAHLHIPRRYNSVGKAEGPQINSLLFQGQVLWALAHQASGNQLSISLNSGRVPLDNTNSGAYLDLPALKVPLTLASKKRHPDSPQSLIPARTKEELQEKIELLNMYKKQKLLSDDQYNLGQKILNNFIQVQSNFSHQVSTSHALMLNEVLPIKQVTLDSEHVGKSFLLALLKDKTSLTYSIFAESEKKIVFLEYLSNIRTGWLKGGSPFSFIARKDHGFRLTEYKGELTPEIIIKGLEENTLWPTGVMKFFAIMVEGGILPVGGWTQTGYCTEVKEHSAELLRTLGFEERAEILMQMPTRIAAVGPCWGLDEIDGNVHLLDAITTIFDPSLVDFSKIKKLTGKQTLLIAAPTLYEFLTHQEPPVGYNDLKREYTFAVI